MEAAQRLVQLGKLVAFVAHEVNNPLMVISGRAQLSLLEENANPELTANLQLITAECQRAKGIIQRLLKFSRPGNEGRVVVALGSLLEEVMALVEHQFGLENVTLRKHFAAQLLRVSVNPQHVQEVFMNIIMNARDAMLGQGGVIEVYTAAEDGWARVEFRDNGPGIEPATLSRITEPFFTTKAHGTGLGLAICVNILRAYDGNLAVESLPGKGTTVYIRLPLAGDIAEGEYHGAHTAG